MNESEPTPAPATRTLSGGKRLLGLLALVAVFLASGAFGLFLSRGGVPEVAAPSLTESIGTAVVGIVLLAAGALVWGLLFLTRAFTFRLDRPFFPSGRIKCWLGKILVELPLGMGFAFVCAPLLIHLLQLVVPAKAVFLVAVGIPFFLANVFFAWLHLMTPVERSLIARRMSALGITPEQYRSGWEVGTSDPGKNSFRKFPTVEEDVGVLWLTGEFIAYRGDQTAWDFATGDVLEVQRIADAGGTSSYFGAVHVILRVRERDGTERRIRLHPQWAWTRTGLARALNDLAAAINRWRATGEAVSRAAADDHYHGFAVRPGQGVHQSAPQ
jgi:hypothetical protein